MTRAHLSPLLIAMTNAQRLSKSDVANQYRLMTHALTEFIAARECQFHWCSLADSANMAETLAAMGLGSGEQADAAINAGQEALAGVYTRHAERGSWTMRAAEIEALRLLIDLHRTQMEACSYGEFEQAFKRTANRISQAKAGNAAKGTKVLIGLVGVEA